MVNAERAEVGEGRPGPDRRLLVLLAAAIAAVLAVGILSAIAGNGQDQDSDVATGAGEETWPLDLDGHRDWLLAALDGRHTPSEAEAEHRLHPAFLEAVRPAEFVRMTATVAGQGPWRVLREVERRGDTVAAVQLHEDGGSQLRLSLMVAGDGRLEAATLLAAAPCADPVDPTLVDLEPALATHLAWLLDLIEAGHDPDDDELRARLSSSFLAEVPPDAFREALGSLRELAPLSPRHYEGAPGAMELALRVGVRTGEEARLTLSVDTADPPHITGAALFTQQPCRLPAS